MSTLKLRILRLLHFGCLPLCLATVAGGIWLFWHHSLAGVLLVTHVIAYLIGVRHGGRYWFFRCADAYLGFPERLSFDDWVKGWGHRVAYERRYGSPISWFPPPEDIIMAQAFLEQSKRRTSKPDNES